MDGNWIKIGVAGSLNYNGINESNHNADWEKKNKSKNNRQWKIKVISKLSDHREDKKQFIVRKQKTLLYAKF